MNAWIVRAGDDNLLIDDFNTNSAVAIGWGKMNDLSDLKTREEFKNKYIQVYGNLKKTNVNAGQLFRFYTKVKNDDYMLTYNKSTREYSIGNVIQTACYEPGIFKYYPHVIKVNWLKIFSRDLLGQPAKNTFGSVLTIFNVNDFIPELEAILNDQVMHIDETGDTLEEEIALYDEVLSKSQERIADMVSGIEAYDFQNLVAAVLKSMGFKAISSPPGRDRGIDIIAHPDEFGFEKPVIKVQVKHRINTSVGGPDMRNFMSTLDDGENGIFVSTGGFTTDAKNEANRYGTRLKLMDRDSFIDLLLENYENIDSEFKRLIPLKRLWLPYTNE